MIFTIRNADTGDLTYIEAETAKDAIILFAKTQGARARLIETPSGNFIAAVINGQTYSVGTGVIHDD